MVRGGKVYEMGLLAAQGSLLEAWTNRRILSRQGAALESEQHDTAVGRKWLPTCARDS